ncbi:TPA: hypothetical protein NV830_001009 [Escherichia coli]|nr:hypothetical protein [Escherichia coli]HCJ8922239.1 hypothetical protein [Escherichia coli]
MNKGTTVYLVTKNTPGWSQCSTVPYKICATLELAQRAEAEVDAMQHSYGEIIPFTLEQEGAHHV